MSKFYVTTPIYYVNDQPHIGHAYTSLAADVLSIYNRMAGREVFFLTGTDEHGQKVEQAAALKGRSPKEHADLMVGNFMELWKRLALTNDFFIRTTDEHHVDTVQRILAELWERREIEKRSYSGWYCTPCERFWTEKDLSSGRCPDCGRDVEQIDEDNYFFLMSKYHRRLVDYIEANPEFILPETRRNEVLGFLRTQPLQDLCISRPKKRLQWGITLPFDDNFVTYVWFDALINYYSAPREKFGDDRFWPADVHLIGKDILTTHAVYWSTMLMAMGLPLPRTIFAHGWWTIEGRKMSKSFGNVVDPVDVADRFGNDAFRFFLFREVPFGLDGDYSESALVSRVNTDLANDFGNLASRAMKMAAKFYDSVVPEPDETEMEMKAIADAIPASVEAALSRLQFQKAIEEIWKLVSYTNKYIDSNAPWALAKNPEDEGRLRTVIYSSLEALRLLAVHLHPFIPAATDKLYAALGQGGSIMDASLAQRGKDVNCLYNFGGLEPGTKISATQSALFPRIEQEEIMEAPKKGSVTPAKGSVTLAKGSVTPKEKGGGKVQEHTEQKQDNLIGIEDFGRVVLKTGHIKSAERVEGSNKLIKLEVDTGEQRQIVAGIGKAYAPEQLVGKTVAVVCNLKPARLMGVESQGMLLAATGKDGMPVLLTPETQVEPGLRIK